MRALPAAFLILAAACASFPDDLGEERWPTPLRGMVVSEHPLATRAGLDALEAGGNAVDAAVATSLSLAVVYPQAGNLGGGGFALWVPHDPAAEPLLLDFRETAPRDLRPEDFLDAEGVLDRGRSLAGHLAVLVPGSPHGLWSLHARLGRLPFSELAAPAIRHAREGYPVDPWLARALAEPETRERLSVGAMAATIFYPGGEPLAEGDLLRQENLADTLELFAREGPRAFYDGDVAAAIVAEMGRGGGKITREDLRAYRSVWRAPLRGWFRGLEVLTAPPPSSGGLVLLQVLSMLDGFPLDEERETALAREALEGAEAPGLPVVGEAGITGRAVHWWVEAMRRSFADRATHLGDPDFHQVPLADLLSPAWIAERRISIGELANPGIGPMEHALVESEETTHVSVLDREGNAVSLTTTLNDSFGSGLMVPGAGFLLNDEVDDFALQAGIPNLYGLVGGSANALEPGKRPLSSMTPTVVRDGGRAVRMVLGSPGGPRIITSVIQVVLRTEVYGQALEEAVRAPRLHQQWSPLATRFEEGWDARVLQDLRNRGHEVEVVDRSMGSVQAIRVEIGGDPEGYGDPRRGGSAGAEGGEPAPPARP